jgi:hypothetical protein
MELALAVVLLAVACSSCGGKTTPIAKQSQASSTVLQSTATSSTSSQAAVIPGGISPHLNVDQLKKIDRGRRDFTFAVFGDNRGSTTVFEDLVGRVNSDNVLFAFDNGDLVDGATTENYRMFVGQITASTRPFLTAVGNHDDGSSDLYKSIFGNDYYAFTVGKCYFIVLDDSNQKDIDGVQLQWLKERLVESRPYRFRFVVMHVPLYDPRVGPRGVGHSLGDPAFAGMLNDLFDQYHVTMLLTSHIHGFFSGNWGSTPYIISGGAGAPLVGSDPQHFFYHYVRIHVSGQGESYEVVKL